MKIVQNISYAQEMKNLMYQQKVSASSSLKRVRYLIYKEVLSEWDEDYSNPCFLIKQ